MAAFTTSRMFCGLRSDLIAASSSINGMSMARRPAVSKITTSFFCTRATARARRHTSTGAAPGSANTGTPTFCPSTWSCSMAAGRCMSAATRRTFLPSFASSRASLPEVVVFP